MKPRLIWSGLAALAALALAGTGPAAGWKTQADPRLGLRWEVTSITFDPATKAPTTHARLILRNLGKTALPPGWTLWFTALGNTAGANRAWPVRRISGSLWELEPAGGGVALAPGESISFPIDHPGAVLRDDKGPTGPYLVLPADPDHGIAMADYAVVGPRRNTPGLPANAFTAPDEAYADNARALAAAAEDLAPVLPAPLRWTRLPGAALSAVPAAPQFGTGLGDTEAVFARRLAARATVPGAARLPFRVAVGAVPGETSPEAYRLTIDARGIALTGASAEGVYRGLTTLDQLFGSARGAAGVPHLPRLEIVDAPRFAWRGLMIDIARNFRHPDEIRAVIDLMAAFKLNRLHLHLADDEGWRIKIPALPELIRIGARRGHSATWADRLPPALGSGPDVTDPHGSGYLTGADYVGLLRYAAARHIEVVPEIDMPGHARAAIRAMLARDAAHPEEQGRFRLTDPADHNGAESAQGYGNNVLNPGLASTDTFIAVVVDELVRLHRQAGVQLHQMHIGGDEVPKAVWEGSPAAQARYAALGGGGRTVLSDNFFDRALGLLDDREIRPMAWEELGLVPGSVDAAINPRFVARGVTVQVWNDFDDHRVLGIRLANAGYRVVFSPARVFYLDIVQRRDLDEPGHDWAGVASLANSYAYDPLDPVPGAIPLSEAGRANVLGIEGTLFSETVRGPWRLNYMLMPRLLALAERGWSPPTDPAARPAAWAAFNRRLGQQVLPFVDVRFPGVGYRLPAPGLVLRDGQVLANYPWPGLTLRYTRDGSRPTVHSPRLTGPLAPGGTITAAAFTASGRESPLTWLETTK